MTTDTTTTLGTRLRSLRQERGWNQTELGQRADLAQSEVSRYESGAATPNLANLLRLARALDVSLDVLVGREQP